MSLVDVNGQSLSTFVERAGIPAARLASPAVVNKRERTVAVKLHLPTRVPFNVYAQALEAFRAFFGDDARQVDVRFQYGGAEPDVLGCVQDYWIYAVDQVLGEDFSLKGELKNPSGLQLEERFLRVPMISEVSVTRAKQKGIDEKLAQWLQEFLDIHLTVQFFADDQKREQDMENFRSLIQEEDRLEGQKAFVAVEEEKKQEATRGTKEGKKRRRFAAA